MTRFTLHINIEKIMIWHKTEDGYTTWMYIVDYHDSTMVDGYGSDWRIL